MTLTLQDLRVQTQHNLLMTGAANPTRPASLADLVEVLKQEGAWIVEAPAIENIGMKEILVKRPGRYLVLPLGDTE